MLPIGIRRTLFRSLARTVFERGFSANYAIRVARGLGLGYQRKLMLTDFREVTGLIKKAKAWRFIPKKYLPPPYLIEKTDFAIRTAYHYVFDVDIRDKRTGLTKTVQRTIASDEILTIRRAEEELMNLVIDPIQIFYEEEAEVLGWKLRKVREKI